MTLPIGWTGVLAPLDKLSGDGRKIATPPALRLRLDPIPFFWQREAEEEHDGSVLVGRIDRAWIEGGNLMGEGPFDLENEDACEAARQLGAGFASRVSVDLDDVTVDFVPNAPAQAGEEDLWMPEGTTVITDWRLAGATMVGVSAFDEAIITPVYETAASPAASGAAANMSLVGQTDLPVAERDTPWDGAAAMGRVFDLYTSDAGTVDTASVSKAFLWRDDTANPETKGAYSLGFADVINGQLQIVPLGVSACAGSRGVDATNIPADDKNRVKARICSLYDTIKNKFADYPDCPFATTPGASLDLVSFAASGEVEVGYMVSVPDPDNPGTEVQGMVTSVDGENVTVSLPANDGTSGPRLVTVPLADVTVVGTEMMPPMMASAAPLVPPREWFSNPNYGLGGEDPRLVPLLGQPGSYAAPLTIDDDGRVSGHLAGWGTCHTGLPGCTTPPSSRSRYAGFMLGETVTSAGRIATGTLTYDTGHADIALDARAAVRHYDNTGTAFATVVVGEDIHGIWVAGALLPDVKPETLPRLRAAKLSGDWRGGELRAALAVNTPGFPTMRARAQDLEHEPLALVASGVVVQERPTVEDTLDQNLVAAIARELERRSGRRATAAQLASRMNQIKAQRLAARVHQES